MSQLWTSIWLMRDSLKYKVGELVLPPVPQSHHTFTTSSKHSTATLMDMAKLFDDLLNIIDIIASLNDVRNHLSSTQPELDCMKMFFRSLKFVLAIWLMTGNVDAFVCISITTILRRQPLTTQLSSWIKVCVLPTYSVVAVQCPIFVFFVALLVDSTF